MDSWNLKAILETILAIRTDYKYRLFRFYKFKIYTFHFMYEYVLTDVLLGLEHLSLILFLLLNMLYLLELFELFFNKIFYFPILIFIFHEIKLYNSINRK